MSSKNNDVKRGKHLKLASYLVIAAFIIPLFGCAAGLTHTQKNEMEGYKAKRLAVQEKSPGTAAVLGLFLGGGSFYTRQYGLGFVDLLFWPLSILWDPVNGSRGAQLINYYSTKAYIQTEMDKEIRKLDYDLEDNTITERQYILKSRRIQRKYSPH